MAGIDKYTSLLLHGNGADGSNKIIDSSPNMYKVTTFGNVQIDTAKSKFGGSSIMFDGTGDYIQLANNNSWDFKKNDFTIDWWMYLASTAIQTVFSSYNNVGGTLINYYFYAENNVGNYVFVAYNTAGTQETAVSWNYGSLTGSWVHMALVRQGTTMQLFRNGSSLQKNIDTGNILITNSENLTIGGINGPPFVYFLSGWIDEFRIQTGTAYWTEDFTPPTSPYSSTTAATQSDLFTPYRPNDLGDGLRGWWKLNEDEGNRYDSSGFNNHLTEVGVIGCSNKDYWDQETCSVGSLGSNGLYIVNASQNSLKTTSSFAAGFWMFPTFSQAGSAVGNNIMASGDLDQGQRNFVLYQDGLDNFSMWVSTAGTDAYVCSGGKLNLFQWNHVVGQFDGPNRVLSVYLNGNIAASRHISTAGITAGTANFTLFNGSSRNTIWSRPFVGNLKDAFLYHGTITPTQIKSLAMGINLEKYGFRPDRLDNLRGYWPLDEAGTNATAIDYSGNGYNLPASSTVVVGSGYTSPTGKYFSRLSGAFYSLTNTDLTGRGTGDFSVGCWFYAAITTSVLTNAGRHIMGVWDNASSGLSYLLYATTDNITKDIVPSFAVSTGGQGSNGTSSSQTHTKQLNWHHICGVKQQSNITLYVDGVSQETATIPTGYVNPSTASFSIGCSLSANSGRIICEGIVQDAFYCSEAISPETVSKLACGLPIQRRGIEYIYQLDDAPSDETNLLGSDTSSNNNFVTSTKGLIGSAGYFETSSAQYYSGTGQYSIQSNLTAFAGYRLKGVSGQICAFVSKVDIPGKVDSSEFELFCYGTQELGMSVWNSGGGLLTMDDNQTMVNDRWYFGTLVMRGSDTAIYRDGFMTRLTNNGVWGTEVQCSSSKVLVGADSNGTRYFMDGAIAEVGVARRWFRPEEIRSAYIHFINSKCVIGVDVDPDITNQESYAGGIV